MRDGRLEGLLGRCAEGAILLFIALFAAPLWAADEPPTDFGGLRAQYDRACKAGEFSKALEVATKMNEIAEPLHLEALYDTARALSLTGSKEKAYEALEALAGAGYWDLDKLRGDEAFRALRQEDRFRSIVRGIWARGYISMLERPEREGFQRPDRVMEALAMKPGERVADVGAGSGYFTVRLSRAVGPDGKVLATDISQEMLDYLAKRLREEKLTNVTLLKVAKDDPNLPPGSQDTVLMVDVMHYVQDRVAFAKRLKAGLAPGGRVVVIDYTVKSAEERPWGPPPEQQVSRASMDKDFAEAGFRVAQSFDFLPEQYFVVYRPR